MAVSFICGGNWRIRRKHWHIASHWQTLSHNVVHLALIDTRTHNISDSFNMRCSFMIFYSDKHERDLDTGYQNLCYQLPQNIMNRIGVVMVSVLSSSIIVCSSSTDRVKPKTIQFGICCFSDKHAALRRKGRDWLALSACCCFSELAL